MQVCITSMQPTAVLTLMSVFTTMTACVTACCSQACTLCGLHTSKCCTVHSIMALSVFLQPQCCVSPTLCLATYTAAYPATRSFTKQISRPSPSVPTSSPAALGPGAYFRVGLPVSFTGKGLLAGHDPAAAAPDFSRARSRPSSGRSPAHCQSHGQLADDPGMWDWAAAAVDPTCCSCVQYACSSEAGGYEQAGDAAAALQEVQANRPVSGVGHNRPGSAALDYVRGQRGTVLVAPAAQDDSWLTAGDSTQPACSIQALQQHQQHQQHWQHQQQQRPSTVGVPQAAARHHTARPASAGILQTCPHLRTATGPTGISRANSGDPGTKPRPQSLQQRARSPHAAQL